MLSVWTSFATLHISSYKTCSVLQGGSYRQLGKQVNRSRPAAVMDPLENTLWHTHTKLKPPPCALSSNPCRVQLEALNQSRRTHKPFQLFIQKNSKHFPVWASHKTRRLANNTKLEMWPWALGNEGQHFSPLSVLFSHQTFSSTTGSCPCHCCAWGWHGNWRCCVVSRQ